MPTLIFDCETIPDTKVYARLLHMNEGLPLHVYEEAWQQAEKPFKAQLQQIVSLAVAWIADNGALQKIATLGPEESTALGQFFQTVNLHHPVLVGWNTSGFDLPVILTRALVQHVDVGDFFRHGLPYQGYLKRYADKDHRDLMDLQSSYRATLPLSLDEMATLLGVPGKLDTAGNQVSALYEAGERQRIHDYCQHDVLTTAWVYRYMAVHRGWWDEAEGQRFDETAERFLQSHHGTHWDEFRAAQSSVPS